MPQNRRLTTILTTTGADLCETDAKQTCYRGETGALFVPLTALYNGFHPGGGVLVHLLAYVAVYVQCERHRRVSERLRYRLGIDARLELHHGVEMP